MKLLFLCTHNRCLSILAEAVARQLCGALIEVQSAGSMPARKVHPLTLEQLALHDIPLRGLRSKSWRQLDDFNPDCIIALGETRTGEGCLPGSSDTVHIHWPLPDPVQLEDDYDACWQCFDEVIATLTQRMLALRDLLMREADRTALQCALQDAAMLFAVPVSRTPKRPALDMMQQWGATAAA